MVNSNNSEYLIIFAATYLLTALVLLAYKSALNDLYVKTRRQIFLEMRSVHPIALLAGVVALVPSAALRHSVDSTFTTSSVALAGAGYFVATLIYRRLHKLKVVDFSIDNGSNFNDEVSADPTPAQIVWLFLVSWAGAAVLGASIGTIVNFGEWKGRLDWLQAQPTDSEARMYLLTFVGLILLSMVISSFFRSRFLRKLPTATKLRRAVNRAFLAPSVLGLMFAFLQDFTRNLTLTNRYWTMLILVWICLVSLWNLVFIAPSARRHLSEDRRFFDERQKRLRQQRSKKRKKTKR